MLVSFAMILLSDLLYRFWPVEGFNQPFTPDHNFGSWVDLAIAGSLNSDHWVAFNAIPTTAHTIWGVIVGMLLMNEWSHIFIYLFSNLGGKRLLTRMAEPFTSFIWNFKKFLDNKKIIVICKYFFQIINFCLIILIGCNNPLINLIFQTF